MMGSSLTSNRYIYAIYPIISVFVIAIFSLILRKCIIIFASVLIICCFSHWKYGIDFQYSDYDNVLEIAQQLRGMDCLLYYGDVWQDVYTAIPLKFIYNETYFLNPNEIGNVDKILNKRQSDNPVVVSLPDNMPEEESVAILDSILDKTSYSEYEYVYHYYTQAYLLK